MGFYVGIIVLAVGLLTGCAGGGYRDNTSYADGYLHTPIDNDIYN